MSVARSVGPNISGRFAKGSALYAVLIVVLSVVSDGWSGKPSPLLHQILLLPVTALAAVILYRILGSMDWPEQQEQEHENFAVHRWLAILAVLECWSLFLIVAEEHHFRAFGYHFRLLPCLVAGGVLVGVWSLLLRRRTALGLFWAVLATYAAGMFVAIRCFPLNYLRSDMLPVIGWADERMLAHLSPYGTMHVGARLYDFPYLPGMLVAFWPAAFLSLDLRWASLVYLLGTAALVYCAARLDRRREMAALCGLFVLCPFLQYRHDLYLEPHWFTLALAVFLMQRRRFVWSAFVWGVSCALYQLSWVVFPFVLLNGFRRRGPVETLKLFAAGLFGFVLVCGPFLRSAMGRIASNTVGQWSRLPHALADPINLSYWLTYLIRPDELKWVQAGVLCALFFFCVVKGRCESLADTLRWMCCALAVFIPLNVIVDGYFYLTLALMVLFFVCAAEGWWEEGAAQEGSGPLADAARPPEVVARA